MILGWGCCVFWRVTVLAVPISEFGYKELLLSTDSRISLSLTVTFKKFGCKEYRLQQTDICACNYSL